jgi:hypothetical protein
VRRGSGGGGGDAGCGVRTMCSTKCARVAGKGRVFSRAARNGAFARGVSFRGGMERRGSLSQKPKYSGL